MKHIPLSALGLALVFIYSLPMMASADEHNAQTDQHESGLQAPTTEFVMPELVGFDSIRDQASYALGMDFAYSLRGLKADLNKELLIEAITTIMNDQEARLPNNLVWKSIQAYHYELDQLKRAKRELLGQKNLAEGLAFLEANRNKENVIETSSGLQYIVIEQGEGNSPIHHDRVKVHFHTTLLDGTEIDNSRKQGDDPVILSADTVMAGWSEALQLMRPGAKWKLFIPHELAYGESGAGELIGPNAVIIMELELVDFAGK